MFFIEKSWKIIKPGSQTTRFTIGITIGFGKDLVGVPPKKIVVKKIKISKKWSKKIKIRPLRFF